MALTNSYLSLFRKPTTTAAYSKPLPTYIGQTTNPTYMQGITPGYSPPMQVGYPPILPTQSYPAPGLPISYPAPGYQQPGAGIGGTMPPQIRPINSPYTGVKPSYPYSPPGGYQPWNPGTIGTWQNPNYSNMPYFLQQLLGLVR